MDKPRPIHDHKRGTFEAKAVTRIFLPSQTPPICREERVSTAALKADGSHTNEHHSESPRVQAWVIVQINNPLDNFLRRRRHKSRIDPLALVSWEAFTGALLAFLRVRGRVLGDLIESRFLIEGLDGLCSVVNIVPRRDHVHVGTFKACSLGSHGEYEWRNEEVQNPSNLVCKFLCLLLIYHSHVQLT
jgi:hypothetical protein